MLLCASVYKRVNESLAMRFFVLKMLIFVLMFIRNPIDAIPLAIFPITAYQLGGSVSISGTRGRQSVDFKSDLHGSLR